MSNKQYKKRKNPLSDLPASALPKVSGRWTLSDLFRTLFSCIILLSAVVVAFFLFATVQDPSAKGPLYLALININLVFGIVVIFLAIRKIILAFVERKEGLIGTRLHTRFLGVFGVFALLPTIMVAIFAGILLNQGIESWFSLRVTSALNGSLQVAQAYLQEHQNALAAEARAIADDPALHEASLAFDPATAKTVLSHMLEKHQVAEVGLYNAAGDVQSFGGGVSPPALPADLLNYFSAQTRQKTGGLATTVQPMTFQDLDERRIVAAYPVGGDEFLVVSRLIDPIVLARIAQTREAFQEYDDLLSQKSSVKWVFLTFLGMMTVCVLGGAIWAGLTLAARIVRPVSDLVHATNKVSAGDLNVRLTPQDDDEIGILAQSFNRMALQLQQNQELLERKSKELFDRRKISEAVLAGVRAGVLLVESNGIIQMANKAARDLIDAKLAQKLDHYGEQLQQMLDDFCAHRLSDPAQQQMRLLSKNGTPRMVLVRMVSHQVIEGNIKSVVVTFDDITELLSVQKVAAWADVARRIAHEIKNPLTPIQLSTERLRRKYLPLLPEDQKEMFDNLTSTVVRQVDDMRRMVNEFSDFARMPNAEMKEEDARRLLEEVVILQREGRHNITFDVTLPAKGEVTLRCDRSHLQRALTNVIENAVNAIEEQELGKKTTMGVIKVVADGSQSGKLIITVADNGRGLPESVETDQLFDPYVTTRKKGTGLGLAIVRKVVDEHGGQIRLTRREEGGTLVEITLPVKKNEE